MATTLGCFSSRPNLPALAGSGSVKIPADIIERDYYLLFSVSFCVILVFAMKAVRFILYHKMQLLYYINKMSSTVRYGLLGNLIMYTVLFMINMSWGEKTGYSKYAIQFNGWLFVLCMIISNYLIIVCIKHVKSEEVRNAEMKKQRLLEDYIVCLENMVEETRAFKHDYKNMLSTMAGFIHEKRLDELQTYFDQQLQRPAYSKLEEMQAWQYLKNVQPIEIKGMLFEKILLALGKGIRVQVEISENVNVEYAGLSDLLRILGVFIDNAIEEVEKEKGLVGIIIAETHDRILFQVMNEYRKRPDLSKIFCKGYSTKGEGRGVGLYMVQSLIHDHEDIVHECKIEKGMFIQKLEIFYNVHACKANDEGMQIDFVDLID